MRFSLTTAGLATVTLAGTAVGATVDFTQDLDRWAGEASFQVISSGGSTIVSQYVSGSLYYAPGSLVSITEFVQYPSQSSHWGTVSGTMELAAGTYTVAMQDSANDGWAWGSFVGGLSIGSGSASFPSAAGGSTSFSFTVVPAPGAMALLGLAGLAARRRRRD